eukprot:10289686-Karenia_brevis.AAC.1
MAELVEGGRAGDVATPRHWNVVLFLILDPVLQCWKQRGFGFNLGSDTLLLLNWADDFVLIASNFKELQVMVKDFAAAMAEHGLLLKASK